MTKILIVEDQPIVAKNLQTKLIALGYDVLGWFTSGEGALAYVTAVRPDIILMDISLVGQMDGLQAARELYEKFDLPVVYLTSHMDDATIERAKATHPFGYLLKPFEDLTLHHTIQNALHEHQSTKSHY